MIYLDHAATTPTDPRVIEQITREMAQPWNASSVHRRGQSARARLEEAREELAGLLNVRPGHLVFTSGASEANNLAIRGLAARVRREGRRLYVCSSALEHSCVRETVERLSAAGEIELRQMPVEESGRAMPPEEMPDAPALLCLMATQNETGVRLPVEKARELVRKHPRMRWLCDATQAFPRERIDVAALGADLVSLSSHKLYGPAGVGALAGPGVEELEPLITGGPQEMEHRAGTQPVALIRGFVLAARLAREELDARRAKAEKLEEVFFCAMREQKVPFELNGAPEHRTAGFLNLSIEGFSGADLVIALDAAGHCVSSGSACATGVMETSPALAAMFPTNPKRAAGALRITPGKDTEGAAMVELARVLGRVCGKGRGMRLS